MSTEIPHLVLDKSSHDRSSWCVHYNGKQNSHCRAGVEYASVSKEVEYTYSYVGRPNQNYSSNIAHPCFKHEASLTGGCDKCQFPTAEEIKAKEDEMNLMHLQVMVARKAIITEIKDARGVAGKMPCPCCQGGTLHYSRASSNGHIRAGCTTEGCVSWIE